MKHPAYPGVIWNLTPHKKGILAAAKTRGGPIDIAWEVHGTGPKKILVSLPSFHITWLSKCPTNPH